MLVSDRSVSFRDEDDVRVDDSRPVKPQPPSTCIAVYNATKPFSYACRSTRRT